MGFNWRNRDVEAEAEEAVDPAVEAAAAERLQRLRGRTASQPETVASGPARTAADPGPFDLGRNPFAVLELDLAASAEAINNAYDALSFEPDRDSRQLDAARAALHSPRERLDAELGWLPGLPGPTLEATRKALRAGDVATLSSVREKAAGVARLNLDLMLAVMDPKASELAARVVEGAGQIDSEALLDQLDDARFRGKVREIERDMFDACLDARAQAMAAHLAPAFAATPAARTALTQVLQQGEVPKDRFGAAFRDALLRAYGAAIDGALEQSRARITAGVEALREAPGNQAHATTLLTTLDLWSSLRRPVQVHEAARGLDDPASAAIFESIRELIVRLSNDHNEFEIALRMGRALIRSFALVPMHRAALQRELPTLLSNALGKRAEQLKQIALSKPRVFAQQIEAGGLERGIGVTGSIAALFADAEEIEVGTALANLFLIIREIAIQLHNKHHLVHAAYLLTEWLSRQGPPPDIAGRLEADLRHFGVNAAVVARESEAEPAGEAPERAAGQPAFGRRQTAGGEAPPPPQKRAPGQERPAWVKAPPAPPPPKVRRARGMRFWQILFLLFVVFTVMRGISRVPGDRAADRGSGSAATRPTPVPSARYTPPSRDEVLRDFERRQEERERARADQPRFVPGQPMVDARPASEREADREGTTP